MYGRIFLLNSQHHENPTCTKDDRHEEGDWYVFANFCCEPGHGQDSQMTANSYRLLMIPAKFSQGLKVVQQSNNTH
jgi:ketosteroid isomerase-like protein